MPHSFARYSIRLLVFIYFFLISTSIFAKDKIPTVVLKFETFDIKKDTMDFFYKELKTALLKHDDMLEAKGVHVTLNEILVTVGCDEGENCLPEIKDFIKGQRIIYGSVSQSENVYVFTIKIYDFSRNKFIRIVEDQPVQGGKDALKKAIPALLEEVFYGTVGEVSITVQGTKEANIFFDGEPAGTAPTTLKSLSLGTHTVMIRSQEGQEQTKTVVLRKGEHTNIVFQFGETTLAPLPLKAESHLTMPGVVSLAVGVLGTSLGVFSMLRLNALNDQAKLLYGDKTVLSPKDLDAAQQHDRDDDVAYTGMILGYSVGAVGLLAGSAMLILPSLMHSESSSSSKKYSSKNTASFNILPTSTSLHIDVRFAF